VPGTGAWLPQYKPVLKLAVQAIIDLQPTAKVFYFDRVSPSTLDLVRYYKAQGALIVFEPSSLKLDKLFIESHALANIVKFSSDRIPEYSDVYPLPIADLEIETLGKEGLRYRLKSSNNHEWTNIHPFQLDYLLDSAGAGDWCTAGIINQLGYDGVKSFTESSKNEVHDALNIGQALGALNCMFFGARGMMYNLNRDQIENHIMALVAGQAPDLSDVHQFTNMTSIENFNFDMIL
jgi:fructokinase